MGIMLWQFGRSPVPSYKLNRLKTGMTQGEVRSTIGPPSGTWEDGTGVCSIPNAWPMVYVYFDEDQNLKEWIYDN